MPESIERIVRGFSVLRLLSIATLLLIVACLIISASIALAEPLRQDDRSNISVAAVASTDVYEFDFEVENLPNAELDEFIPH